jgi:hypothetical protein
MTRLNRRSVVTGLSAAAAATAIPAPLGAALLRSQPPVLLAFTDAEQAAHARTALDDLDIGAVPLDLHERLRRRLPRFGGISPEAVRRRAIVASHGCGPYDDDVGMGYARMIAQQFAFRPLILRPEGCVEMWFVPDWRPGDGFVFYWERPVALAEALREMRPTAGATGRAEPIPGRARQDTDQEAGAGYACHLR